MSDPDAPVRSLPAGILEYELPDGWLVFAGKTDAANDYVSLKLARQNDRWFHVRVSQTEPIVRVICEQRGTSPRELFETLTEEVRRA